MSFTTTARGFKAKMLAVLVAIATVFGAVQFVTAENAAADNRGLLRQGCDWDPYMFWVQYCMVPSAAMGRDVPVQIRAANGGGNAGLYLLDGLYGYNPGASAWIWSGHAAQTFKDDNVTLVAPASGDASFYTNWMAPAVTTAGVKNHQWETFLTSELPAYLQANFGVSPNNNAIAGLSMGATAAVSLGARHRDQFKQITALSGYYQISNPVVATGLSALQVGAGVMNPDAMWGPAAVPTPQRLENDPENLIGQLQGMPMYISSADGVPSIFSNPEILNRPAPQLPDTVWRSVMESVSRASSLTFEEQLKGAGVPAEFHYSGAGIHSWELWATDTVNARQNILSALGV